MSRLTIVVEVEVEGVGRSGGVVDNLCLVKLNSPLKVESSGGGNLNKEEEEGELGLDLVSQMV